MLSPLLLVWITWWVPFDAHTVIHWPDGRTCYYGERNIQIAPMRDEVTCRGQG